MNNVLMPFYPLVLAVFIFSFIGTFLVRAIGRKCFLLSKPRKDRWNTRAVVLHGGLGFFPVFMFASIYLLIDPFEANKESVILQYEHAVKLNIVMLIGSFFMFVLGWVDDVLDIKPITKIVIQFVVASTFIFSGGVFHFSESTIIDYAITYLWIIGIVNAVNMLDNMDGLSSGVVFMSAITLVFLSFDATYGLSLAIPIAMLLAAMMLGFLFFNYSPATIFMGDSGSLSIGYVLATLSIPSTLNAYFGLGRGVEILYPMFISVAVVAVPMFDIIFVTINRILQGDSVFIGGQDHTSHRLVLVGFTERQAVCILYCFAVISGLIALLIKDNPALGIFVFSLYALMLVVVGVYLSRVDVCNSN